jgi:hypothetical protein
MRAKERRHAASALRLSSRALSLCHESSYAGSASALPRSAQVANSSIRQGWPVAADPTKRCIEGIFSAMSNTYVRSRSRHGLRNVLEQPGTAARQTIDEGEITMENKKMKLVYVINERGGRNYWNRIGIAFVNADGSLNVRLDAVPVTGQMQIRDYVPREASDDFDKSSAFGAAPHLTQVSA